MGEEKGEPFRFLLDDEFNRLSTVEKAIYISRAAQELEDRQRRLRDQTTRLIEEQQK